MLKIYQVKKKKHSIFPDDYDVTANFMSTMVSELSIKTSDFISAKQENEIQNKINSLFIEKGSLIRDEIRLKEAFEKQNDENSQDINIQKIQENFFQKIEDYAKNNNIVIDNNQEILNELKERLQTSNQAKETTKGEQIQTVKKERPEIQSCKTLEDIKNILLQRSKLNYYRGYNVSFWDFFLKELKEKYNDSEEEYDSKAKKVKQESEKEKKESEINSLFMKNIGDFRLNFDKYQTQEQLKEQFNQKRITQEDINKKREEIEQKEKEIIDLQGRLGHQSYSKEQKKIIFDALFKVLNISIEHFNSLKSKNFLELFMLLDMNEFLIDKYLAYDNDKRKSILKKFEEKKTIKELFKKINSNIALNTDEFDEKYQKEIKEKILSFSLSFIFPLSFFFNRMDNFFTIDIKNHDFRKHLLFLLDKEYKEILNEESKNSFREDKINFLEISDKFGFLDEYFIYEKNELTNQFNYFNITEGFLEGVKKVKYFYFILENLNENLYREFLDLIKNENGFIQKISEIQNLSCIFTYLNKDLHSDFLNLIKNENDFIKKINNFHVIVIHLNKDLHSDFLKILQNENGFIQKINDIKDFYLILRFLNKDSHSDFLKILQNELGFLEFKNSFDSKCYYNLYNNECKIEKLNDDVKNLYEKYLKDAPSNELSDISTTDVLVVSQKNI